MLNKLIKLLFHKEIILYNRHRQTIPIIENPENRAGYYFFEIQYLWKMIPFSGKNKWKYRIMYQVLNFISPKYILDINWIGKWHSLYYLWCKRHPESKFVVVQHGSYVGGVVTDIPHRYARCNIFLCWSDYFKELFVQYNRGKKVTFINFGNPVYNQADRVDFIFKNEKGNRILLAPSGIKGERLQVMADFKNHLEVLGFFVDLKEHNFQTRRFEQISGFNKIKGDIYEILAAKEYDLVICDHSSSLLDALHFKNKVLFFDPEIGMEAYFNNIYSRFLPNLSVFYRTIKSPDDLWQQVNTQSQEKLYRYLSGTGNNQLSNLS